MIGSLGRGDVEQPRDDEDDCREDDAEAEAEAEAETDGARVGGLTTRDDAARSVARAMAGRMTDQGNLETRRSAESNWICNNKKAADDVSS